MPKKKRPPKEPQLVTYDDLPDAEREALEKQEAELVRDRKPCDRDKLKDDIPF